MADLQQLERAFRAVLSELGEYLGDLVVIGGWVPHLYRKYGGFSGWVLEAPLTAEVDLLIGRPLTGSRGNIADALRAAGFKPDSDRGDSAIWMKDPMMGEKVEFLITHQGTARQQGQVVSVAGQKDLGAISLVGLDILGRHTSVLKVPLGILENELVTTEVRVPKLGAYVINKGVTFPYRTPRAGEVVNPKRAKDLLYLRDLMAAGDKVVERIVDDLHEISNSDKAAVSDIRSARNNLSLVLRGALQAILPECAEALTVRLGMLPDSATADLTGHLTDLEDIFEDALRGQ